MEYYDNDLNDNVFDDESGNKDLLNEAKKLDKGYTKISSFIERSDGSLKKMKKDIYTSGFIGSHIRNAETGEYYRELVGSRNEELYFKIKISTGELKSKNGSNTLFYLSPEHCMKHLFIDVPQDIIDKWEISYKNRSTFSTFKKGGAKSTI